MIIEEGYIPANVGMQSLIGVGRARPCGWGNYFWFGDGLRMAWTRHPRCVNMWAENLVLSVQRAYVDWFTTRV